MTVVVQKVEQVIYTQEAPPEWVRSLRAVDPIRDHTSYLAFQWYAPAERWVLYEMVPLFATPPEIIEELKGFNPDVLEPGSTIISARQWRLFRETGRWARPCWVLQGSKGGHLLGYEEEHRLAAKAHGLPLDPPAPGDLPYCGWDTRTERQILRMNRLLDANNDMDAFLRANTGDGLKAKRKERVKQYRAELVRWMNDQLEEPAELFQAAYRKGEFEHQPVSDVDWVKQHEEQEERFIESSSLA